MDDYNDPVPEQDEVVDEDDFDDDFDDDFEEEANEEIEELEALHEGDVTSPPEFGSIPNGGSVETPPNPVDPAHEQLSDEESD